MKFVIVGLVCLVIGLAFGIYIGAISQRLQSVGELWVDTEKEILQLVFDDPSNLDKTVHRQRRAQFDVVHKSLEFNVPQEKHSL